MVRTFRTNTFQAIAHILLTIFVLPCIATSAVALTKEELLTYNADVKRIVEENMLQLKPGCLKETPLRPVRDLSCFADQ